MTIPDIPSHDLGRYLDQCDEDERDNKLREMFVEERADAMRKDGEELMSCFDNFWPDDESGFYEKLSAAYMSGDRYLLGELFIEQADRYIKGMTENYNERKFREWKRRKKEDEY